MLSVKGMKWVLFVGLSLAVLLSWTLVIPHLLNYNWNPYSIPATFGAAESSGDYETMAQNHQSMARLVICQGKAAELFWRIQEDVGQATIGKVNTVQSICPTISSISTISPNSCNASAPPETILFTLGNPTSNCPDVLTSNTMTTGCVQVIPQETTLYALTIYGRNNARWTQYQAVVEVVKDGSCK